MSNSQVNIQKSRYWYVFKRNSLKSLEVLALLMFMDKYYLVTVQLKGSNDKFPSILRVS